MVSHFIGVTAQEEPESSARAGREGEAVCQGWAVPTARATL